MSGKEEGGTVECIDAEDKQQEDGIEAAEDADMKEEFSSAAADDGKIVDSDSDDDDEFYGNGVPESNIASLAQDSALLNPDEKFRQDGIDLKGVDSIKDEQPVTKFTFHDFGHSETSFEQVMSSMVTMRNSIGYQSTYSLEFAPKTGKGKKESKPQPIPRGSFDVAEFQRTMEKSNRNTRISQFRPKPPKWDMSAPDEALLKELWRTCDSDPTGRRIFDLGRDLAKDATPWKPGEFDKDILPPNIAALSPSFQAMLVDHLDAVIARTQAEYDKMPAKTIAQGELKSNVGADLATWTRERESIRNQLGLDL
mmetsp:Transcript_10120/g.16626  ORF Transcript_10120/g.16626 Transcript_10120/m.16626 type:complete len:310 (+) Transcript_10120:17-946(+)